MGLRLRLRTKEGTELTDDFYPFCIIFVGGIRNKICALT